MKFSAIRIKGLLMTSMEKRVLDSRRLAVGREATAAWIWTIFSTSSSMGVEVVEVETIFTSTWVEAEAGADRGVMAANTNITKTADLVTRHCLKTLT